MFLKEVVVLIFTLAAIRGNQSRRVDCPEGTTCVPFSRCKSLCILAREGNLINRPQAKSSICGFEGNEASHCCEDAEVSDNKFCDINEILRPVKNPLEDNSPLVVPRTREENCGIRPALNFAVKCTDCEDSVPGMWPWMALLRTSRTDPNSVLCGGALISKNFVLTAAHCLEQASIKAVVLGENDRTREYDCFDITNCPDDDSCIQGEECADKSLVLGVEKTVPHPRYGKPGSDYDYDIGLVRLVRSVAFTDFIRPICLPISSKEEPNQPLAISGWGNVNDVEKDATSKLAHVLQYAYVEEAPLENCTRAHGWQRLTQRQMCATSGKDGRGACRGDSGGPLARRVDLYEDQWEVAGVVSFGTNCGVPETVYTRIKDALILAWIRDTTGL